MRFPTRMAVTALALLSAFPAAADTIEGKGKALDGDTLVIDGRTVDLWGIDAPEPTQTCTTKFAKTYPCGTLALRVLTSMTIHRKLSCEIKALSPDGTATALCRVGRIDIGAQMLQRGWALAAEGAPELYKRDETAARALKDGLWKGRFDTPWDWRSGNRTEATGEP